MMRNQQYTMTFQVNDKPGELISSLKPTAYTDGGTHTCGEWANLRK
jgi:ACT domain-containing protein